MNIYEFDKRVNPVQLADELRLTSLPVESWIEPRGNKVALSYQLTLTPTMEASLGVVIDAHVPKARILRDFSDDDGDTGIRLEESAGSDEDVVIIKTEGKDRVTIGGVNFNSKMLDMKDDTGSDVRLWQIGTLGSAFHILKKSLGTWLNPTAVTNGTKIGALAFQADDGNDGNTPQIGAEVSAYAIEDHDENVGGQEIRIGVTPKGTKGRQTIAKFRGDSIILPKHVNGYLSTDENGVVTANPVPTPVTRFSQQSAFRVTCKKDGTWVTSDDDQFGANYHAATETAGSGNDPIYEWEHQGMMVSAGEALESFLMSGRVSSGLLDDVEVCLVYRHPSDGFNFDSGIDADSEMTEVTLLRQKFFKPGTLVWGPDFAGSVYDMHRRFIHLDYTFPHDGWLTMYFRGTDSSLIKIKDSNFPVTRRYNFRSAS